ncbi:DNA primase [Leptolyngbya sp. FACHB-261]|uniref:DNA primase n=1 Tax=Leptolyngbya sp. FACHB-261 TaxID=2692806 RepID=UPI001689B98F|nr:DNA primase [Leptolyngbya sp. FACHB-261]MBD2103681.1 DNA primase [Leptolyngbya sp. FACHB-261]
MDIPRLHPSTIDEVRTRTDIVDVVSDHVVLRKQGKSYLGSCPFHDDSSPSFNVSPGRQFFKCFGCGQAGDVFTFLMELNKRSFTEVVLDLAQRYSVPVRTLEPEKRQELQRQISLREQLYEILASTANFYEHALGLPQGEAALTYLKEGRQLSETTIRQFKLGYAPGGWATLYGFLVEQRRYPPELVEQAGLILPRKEGRGYYDRFRDRLMIPICDVRGRVVGFGGRSLGDEQPKYLNSPETELFNKGALLFGLDQAHEAIRRADQALVVEGYFDVIALHQVGITHAVASMGTALSAAQVRSLLRYTDSKQVVFNFDADQAGATAAERAIAEVRELAARGEVQLRILAMPEGKDPDEYLRAHSPEQYRELLSAAPLWLDWQIDQILEDKDLRQADQLQTASQDLVKLLSGLPNAIVRTHYTHECAQRLSLGNSRMAIQLEEELREAVRGNRWHGRSRRWQAPIATSRLEVAESQLLQLYLHFPQYRSVVEELLAERDLDFMSHYRFLWQQIQKVDTETDLIEVIQIQLAEEPDRLNQVMRLFWLDENARIALMRAPLVLKASIAYMEQVICDKRHYYFMDLWEKTDVQRYPELGYFYQDKIYAEKRRIQELEEQRRITYADLLQNPLWEDFGREDNPLN